MLFSAGPAAFKSPRFADFFHCWRRIRLTMTEKDDFTMDPGAFILRAERLSFGYLPAPAPLLFNALSLTLPPGVTFLCGDESSGKTTLLQLLAGVLPTRGELRIQGVSLAQNPVAYRRQVAWLDPRDTGLDEKTANQIFAAILPTCKPDALRAHIDGLSLGAHLDKTLTMMSTGTRRKVLIAATLAAEAPVTLLDQPFKALDRPSIDHLLALLAQASGQATRAWVVADYEPPPGVELAGVIELGI